MKLTQQAERLTLTRYCAPDANAKLVPDANSFGPDANAKFVRLTLTRNAESLALTRLVCT